MAKQVLEIEVPTGKKAEWVDGFLKLVDIEQEPTETKKDNRPITERVKTFEDACKELGEDHKLVQQFKAIENAIAKDKEATAYFKLGIITAALNEGWKPDFTNDEENRYYPWLFLWKKERNLQLWVVAAPRLAHKTEKLAIYSGKQFTELWSNYTTGKEVTSWRNS